MPWGAETALRRAIELDPAYWFPHAMLGYLHMHRGDARESLAAMRRARELDPLLPVNHTLSAHAAFGARNFDLAAQFARQALAIDSTFWLGHFHLAQACVALGEYELALAELAEASRTSSGNSKVVSLRGYLLARQGRTDEARQVIGTLVALAAERYVPPCAIALIHLGLGDLDSTADYIEQAYEARDVHLKFVPVDSKWDTAREHPRISSVLARLGLGVTN